MTTSQRDDSEQDRPIEEQGLPTDPLDDGDDAGAEGRSFGGDRPEAGEAQGYGTKANDADPDEADAARAADESGREAEEAHDSAVRPDQSYGGNPTAEDAPAADREQPLQNPDSPLGREHGAEPA